MPAGKTFWDFFSTLYSCMSMWLVHGNKCRRVLVPIENDLFMFRFSPCRSATLFEDTVILVVLSQMVVSIVFCLLWPTQYWSVLAAENQMMHFLSAFWLCVHKLKWIPLNWEGSVAEFNGSIWPIFFLSLIFKWRVTARTWSKWPFTVLILLLFPKFAPITLMVLSSREWMLEIFLVI